jgi:hypothetical protein
LTGLIIRVVNKVKPVFELNLCESCDIVFKIKASVVNFVDLLNHVETSIQPNQAIELTAAVDELA